MKSIRTLLERNKNIRVIGFDDAPFSSNDTAVNIVGIVCIGSVFEGMLWDEIIRDGTNSTDVVIKTFKNSKFFDQVNAVLFDGIAFGGFNVIDLQKINMELGIPAVSVMRKLPDLEAIHSALENVPESSEKWNLILKAGPIIDAGNLFFQVHGLDSETTTLMLRSLTINGNVPEPLRIAHFVGSAIKTGQSSKRA